MEASGTAAVPWGESEPAEVNEFAEWLHALARRCLPECDADDAAQNALLALCLRHGHEEPHDLRALGAKVCLDEVRCLRKARCRFVTGVDLDRFADAPAPSPNCDATELLWKLRRSACEAGVFLTPWENDLFDALLQCGTMRGASRKLKSVPFSVRRGLSTLAEKLRIGYGKRPDSGAPPDG